MTTTHPRTTARTRILTAASLATGAALALGGCSASQAPEDAGSGVAFGASMEEYQAAFADIDPIHLVAQVDGAEGWLANVGRVAYLESLGEWSDGKLDIEIVYGSAIAGATDSDDALADGRMDIANAQLSYEPDIYPINNRLTDASFIGPGGLAGTLVSTAWMTEMIYSDPAYLEEVEAEGMMMLLPQHPMWATFVTPIACAGDEPRDDSASLSGAIVAATGTTKTAQVEALGATPASVGWLDQYEALQRGSIDCTASSMSALFSGLTEIVPQLVVDPEVRLGSGNPTLAVGLDVWESLPLVAQQLMFDRLDVYLATEITAGIDIVREVVQAAQEHGGTVVPLASDARSALRAANDELLEEQAERGADVDSFIDAADRWTGIVDDLGYDSDDDLIQFLADHETKDIDPQPYIDELFERVLLEHRPA